MSILSTKQLGRISLLVSGLACLAFAAYEYHYARLVAVGNQAVVEQRFDTQNYEQASHFWLAQTDALLFNQGVIAYKARNLPRAAEYFRQTLQRTTSPTLRMQAHYNLGLVMLALEEAERAAEFFKEALRLEPYDKDTKFNLERLYQFVLRQEGAPGEAALKQAPGSGNEKKPGSGGEGQGRSKPGAGI
jgi:tetratricopeptide (TPR) repeat protein